MTEQSDLVWTLLASLLIGNTLLLVLNLPLAPLWAKLLRIPRPYLYAGILFFACLGAYAANQDAFDIFLLLVFGLLGLAMRRFGLPVLPLILGVILGPLMELKLREALTISDGDLSGLWSEPLAVVVYILTALVVVVPIVVERVRPGLDTPAAEVARRHEPSNDEEDRPMSEQIVVAAGRPTSTARPRSTHAVAEARLRGHRRRRGQRHPGRRPGRRPVRRATTSWRRYEAELDGGRACRTRCGSRWARDVADQVLAVADEVDAALIVVGLRRRTPVGKLIMGSVAQRILLGAHCPVLAVKPADGLTARVRSLGTAGAGHTRRDMTTEPQPRTRPRRPALGRHGDPRLCPQRGRLRGAGRPARGRRVPAGRRPGRRRHRRGQHLRLRRGGQEGLGRHAARRPPTSRTTGRTQAVVAVGCLAERYGKDLAESLPEADAVLGFDDYPDIAARLRSIVAGEAHQAHTPQDRRRLLPITPVERRPRRTGAGARRTRPARPPLRRRLDAGPIAPLKLASGCDRRCSFCAIPAFRGSFVSRRPVRRARRRRAGWPSRACASCSWSARTPRRTARTSATCGCSRRCCPSWPPSTASSGSGCPTCSRPRPGPGLVEAIATTPGVTPYFDLSFQHASAGVLRRMRRFGDPESFLGLLEQIRALAPEAGVRSNVIVGFPGETEDDLADAVRLPGRRPARRHRRVRLLRRGRHRGRDVRRQARRGRGARPRRARRPRWSRSSPPSAPRSGSARRSRCSSSASTDGDVEGRAAHQGPEVDGTTYLLRLATRSVGDLVRAVVVDTEGVDLVRDGSCDDRGRRRPAQQLERPQRADDAADRDGAVLRLGAAASTAATRSLWRCVAFVIFVVAMITDKIDGDIARKRNLVTNFGKIADPIADKAITGMAFIGLSIVGDIWWWVTIVVLLREWSVTLLRLSVLKHVVIAAADSGKIKTTFQAIALSGLLLPLPHGERPRRRLRPVRHRRRGALLRRPGAASRSRSR